MRLGPFDRAAQVQAVGIEHQPLGRNRVPPITIRPAHIEDDFLVRQQFVVQPQVVAVRIELLLDERIDDDVPDSAAPEFRCR